MTIELFLFMLLVVTTLTGLFTEAIKKVLDELKVSYHANILAGIEATILSIAVSAGYVVLIDAQLNSKLAVMLIALVLMSWLSSMVGYDKVIQAIAQIKQGGAGGGSI